MKFPTFSISLSLLSYKWKCPTQKPQRCYCPDGLLVKLSVFQAELTGSNPASPKFFHFFLNLFFHMFWAMQIVFKIEPNKTKVLPVTVCVLQCIIFEQATKLQCSMHHCNSKIRQPKDMLCYKNRHYFFLLRMPVNTCEKEKIWILFRHIVVSKPHWYVVL